ncbi:Transcriptional regulator [Tumidithrix helvetica PCC 7403]|uniref:NACHT C-terminal helical domain 2-containing protein n=1 Tax=Tumidithrix helvetica TaxID=3457545 RepID=UPI003CB105C3
MSNRSLTATTEGIKEAKIALQGMRITQDKLAKRLDVTRQPIGKFFGGKSVSSDLFVSICKVLNLNWEVIAGLRARDGDETLPAIDFLVQQIREAISERLRMQCGTMRVLDMPQPIALIGENGIYTNVNILERPTRLRTEQELLNDEGIHLVDERLRSIDCQPGLDVVRNHPRLMILGKPGAGKTTFLKNLAMQCITGSFAADKVPFFVTLKDFAEAPESLTLVEYLAKSLSSLQTQPFHERLSGISTVKSVQQLLQNGRSLVLLDGLDEVRKEHTEKMILKIQDAAFQFSQSLFVITCRIAANEYVFQGYAVVEVADFDDQQIATFAENWFRAKNDFLKATTFVKSLQKNAPIRGLASNPLLLTLLCFVFGESGEFPRRRADLYEEGIKIWLKKWDATRNVQRDELYKKLDVRRREDLLSYVAFHTFLRKEMFFKQKRIEDFITEFLQNLRDVDSDPEMLRTDSEAVLKAIEARHGLLVERARGVYSFSHLTLQEYFVAREISLTNQPTKQIDLLQILICNFSDPRWREVFLLTMELLRNASDLLLEIKKEIDSRVANDQKLQDFLRWVQEKSFSVSTPYKPSLVRSFYYSLALSYYSFAPKFDYDLAEKLDSNFDCKFIYPTLKLDDALNITLDRAIGGAGVSLSHDLYYSLTLAENNELKNQLQELYNRHPHEWSPEEEVRQWRTTEDGQLWVQDLRASMITHRNIGQVLDFTSKQIQLLRHHYDSNLFLWECLNTAYDVDRDIREHIEEALFLTVK